MRMKKEYVRRKSDGKILKVAHEKGKEICVIEDFPFWSEKGTVMMPVQLWQTKDRYEVV